MYGCVGDVLTVVAMLSVDSVLYTPQDQRERAVTARQKFSSLEGDHITMLNIYRAYRAVKGNKVGVVYVQGSVAYRSCDIFQAFMSGVNLGIINQHHR